MADHSNLPLGFSFMYLPVSGSNSITVPATVSSRTRSTRKKYACLSLIDVIELGESGRR